MYLGNVVQIDDWVGEIIQAVTRKWGDDVMIIFSCDHGDMMGNHDLWGKNNLMFDDILRVPLFIRYPEGRNTGNCDALVSLIDLMPTIAGQTGYDGGLTSCDGRDLIWLAREGGRNHVLCEADNRFGVITRNGGKYVESLAPGHERNEKGRPKQRLYREFYNLNQDPHEFENLINSNGGGRLLDECLAIRNDHADVLESVLFSRDHHEKPPWYFGNDNPGTPSR